MKRVISVFVLLLSIFFVTSSQASASTIGLTQVEGYVKNSQGQPVMAATVNVTCHGPSGNVSQTTYSSGGTGYYAVLFQASQCPDGRQVSVVVSGQNESGSGAGTVQEVTLGYNKVGVNITMGNNTQVPEFGLITGAVAAIASAGSFFALRKRV